jgi:DNA-binding MarR family transcriptional regulator
MSTQTQIEKAVERYWEVIPPAWHKTRTVIRGTADEKFDLTVEQFQVLRRIRKGIASVSAIADDNHTSRSAVSKAVDVLVNRGLILRNQDPNDRRNIPLALTKKGEHAMLSIFTEAEGWLAMRIARLNDPERATLLGALDMIYKAFVQD